MAAVRYETTVDLELVTCCTCAGVFGVNTLMHKRQFLEAGKTFYCPLGHPNVYGETEVSRLKKQLAQEAKKCEVVETNLRETKKVVTEKAKEVERQERRVSAYKGQVTRTKNKIARGICPCCDTYFPDLHSHMTEKHPEYEQADETEDTGMTVRS